VIFLPAVFFIAFTMLAVRLLALASFKDMTAQAAAGIQPIIVICNKKQRMPVRILPLKINESQGSNIAISVMNGFAYK
jgi:uncharacterized iron-regulated membrane protein